MNAGIPPDPGKYLLANINAQGQVTLSLCQQFQAPNNLPTADAGTALSVNQQGSSSSSPAIDAMSVSTLQGNGSPTLSHLPVVAPPATQLSPSAPNSLSNAGTQVPPLFAPASSSMSSAPGSSSTALASSPATSIQVTSNVPSTPAVLQSSASASLPVPSSPNLFPTTTTALAELTSGVSVLPTTIAISSQTKTPSSVATPRSSSIASVSAISSPQAQSSKISSSSRLLLTSAITISAKTPSLATSTSSTTVQTTKPTASSSSPSASTQTKTTTTTSSSTAVTAPTTSALLIQSKPTSLPASSSSLSQSPSSRSVAPSGTPVAIQSSNLNVHDTSFYVGIALGTIAALAFVLVLLAWCIRFRRHEKRRRLQNTVVPWATEGGDEEQGSVRALRVSPSLENLAHMRNWEPRGDRDVGEPRRANGGPDKSVYSLQNSSIPGYNATSDESLASSIGSTAPLQPRNTLRQLPSHMIDAELAAKGHGGDYFRRFHGSRQLHLNPYIGDQSSRKGSLGDRPPVESAQRNLVDRLRKVGKSQTSDTLPQWDRLPTPGKDQPTQDFEPWAASIRASHCTV